MQHTTSAANLKPTTREDVARAVEAYRDKGYARPIPLPYGEKKIRLKGVTGYADPAHARLKAAESLTDHSGNVALVMDSGTEDFDLTAVDVDDYDERNGYANLMQLCSDLGVQWEESLRTSRRGAEDRSGKRLFRVPPGLKFARAACKGVDIIQLTHRYAVVAPSVVDGMAEQWFSAEGEVLALEDLPRVEDLPWLNEKLVSHLSEGSRTAPAQPSDALGDDQAVSWLESVSHKPSDVSAGSLSSMTEFQPDVLAGVFRNGVEGRHDTMIALQRRIIRAGVVDGTPGVLVALERLQAAFIDAMTDPTADGRTVTVPVADREFARGLRGEVNKLRGAIEHGTVRALGQVLNSGALSPIEFTSLSDDTDDTAPAQAVDFSALERVEELMWSHGGDDLPAQLLLEFFGDFMAWKLDLHNNGGLSLFDVAKGEEVPPGATFRPYLRRHVLSVVKAYRAQLPDPDTLEDDTEKAQLKALLKKCSDVLSICESENRAKPVLSAVAGLLAERGDVLRESDADSAENLLGLSDGHVIDLNGWRDGKSLPDSVRPRDRTEIVTKSLRLSSTEIRSGVARLEAGDPAPVAELFRLVFGPADVRQAVLELMAYSLHGSNPHRLVWGIQGDTGTGKSTVMGFLTRTLGGYAAPTTMAALSDRSGGNNSAKAAALRARLAFTEEFSQDTKGNRDALKEIASNVHVSVTDKFKCSEEHRGTVVAFTTNEPARVDFDAALEDRFVVVPTACTQEQVNALLSGFEQGWDTDPLNRVWLLSMLADAYARPWSEGFRKAELPAEIQECTSQFVAESNPVNRVIDERLIFTGNEVDHFLPTKRILDVLNEDMDEPLTNQKLSPLMLARGADADNSWRDVGSPDGKKKRVRGYMGVRLRVEEDDRPVLKAVQ